MTFIDRVRKALAERTPREVRMFGGTSFMVDDRMLLSVRPNALLLRVDPTEQAELIAAGAQPAYMGTGRVMGPGWITVDQSLLAGSGLDHWIGHADRWHAQLDD